MSGPRTRTAEAANLQKRNFAVVEAVEAVPDPGNTTWMMISTILVLFMTIPGLALFYGGLVRAKNMLSVLMQVLTIVARS